MGVTSATLESVNEFAATPASEVSIDAALVTALLTEQHPDLVALPLGDRHEGWDNVTWRLGSSLAMRLPRRAIASTLVATELAWLPRIGKDWPFRTPIAVRTGTPSATYPWWWSVVPWIDGEPAFEAPLSVAGARDLGHALRAIHQPAPPDAPLNPFRSTPLTNRIDRTCARIEALASQAGQRSAPPGTHLDAGAAEHLVRRAARLDQGDLVCAHLDLHGHNIITKGGRLAGIIDWGDAGAGDRATDLGQAYVLLGQGRWRTMLGTYGATDRTTRERAKAEALVYAVTLATMTDEPYTTCGWDGLIALGVATAGHD